MSVAKGTTIATPFEVTEGMFLWAWKQKPPLTDEDLRDQTEQFIDYHLARGTRFLDWQAAWRTWMRNQSLVRAGSWPFRRR